MSVFIFVVYLVMLVAIGYVTFRKTKSYDDFTLGGRSNNKWISALSTESTDMSSWLLLGLPGMAFTSGYGSIWLLIGLLFGTFFNWAVVAGKLRRITEYYHSITLMEFFENRLGAVSYTHLRAHETRHDLVCRLLLEKKKKKKYKKEVYTFTQK